MPEPKALIFDMDGVIVNSERAHIGNWLDIFRRHGVSFPEDRAIELQGLRGEQVAEWIVGHLGDAVAGVDWEAIIQEKRRVFIEESIPLLEEVPGAESILRANKGVRRLGLVTSSRLKTVGRVLLHFNWRNIFEVLVAAEHVANHKPHPEPFLQAAHRLKVEPGECLVFEDSPVGVASARAAGMMVCGVTTTRSRRELLRAGAHWTIEDFTNDAELARMLAGERPGTLAGFLQRWVG